MGMFAFHPALTGRPLRTLDSHWGEVAGKRVLLRVDLNVPLGPEGETLCDYRIRRIAGLVRRLRGSGSKVMICSHLGRPAGPDPQLSLIRFLPMLQRLLGCSVRFLPNCVGNDIASIIEQAGAGTVFLLENLRFHSGEAGNDATFARALAALADLVVNDAFAVSHRSHASVVGLPRLLPSFAGPGFADEYRRAVSLVTEIRPPVVVLSGGIKLDKLLVYRRLLPQVDALLLGSGFAAALRSGDAELQDPLVAARLVGPVDVVVDGGGHLAVQPVSQVAPGARIVDLGPAAADCYLGHIHRAGTVVFNGSLGLLPLDHPLSQTRRILWEVAGSRAVKVACGGTGCSLFIHEGLAHRVDYIFPGGGAILSFLNGQTNPAIPVLMDLSAGEWAKVAAGRHGIPANGGGATWGPRGSGGPSDPP